MANKQMIRGRVGELEIELTAQISIVRALARLSSKRQRVILEALRHLLAADRLVPGCVFGKPMTANGNPCGTKARAGGKA